MSNQWDISLKNVKLIFIIVILFTYCRSFQIPKQKNIKNLKVVFSDFLLPASLWQRGKLCLVSHFSLKCRSLKKLSRTKTEYKTIASLSAYDDRIQSYPSGAPSYFGLSLNLRKTKMFVLEGELSFSSFSLSKKAETGIFIVRGYPPYYSLFDTLERAGKNNLLSQYFLCSRNSYGRKLCFISKNSQSKEKKIQIFSLYGSLKKNTIFVENFRY